MLSSCTHNESSEVNLENSRRVSREEELLEEVGLDERIGLHTLGLLYRHFQPITAEKTSGHLQKRYEIAFI